MLPTRIAAAAFGATIAAGSGLADEAARAPDPPRIAAELSRSYLRAWSSREGATSAEVARVYAPHVWFYGRLIGRERLLREKERFVRRWPVRSYGHRPGTLRVACSAEGLCRVQSLLEWRAESPERRAVAHGLARFEQHVRVSGPRPSVVLETGSVLSAARRPPVP